MESDCRLYNLANILKANNSKIVATLHLIRREVWESFGNLSINLPDLPFNPEVSFYELCGQDFFGIMKWRPSEDFTRYWFAQIALALAYIHSKAILHNDILFKNIFVQFTQPNLPDLEYRFLSSVVKLGDFGVAVDLSKYSPQDLKMALTEDIGQLGRALGFYSGVYKSDLLQYLIKQMCRKHPLTAEEVLKHPWLQANTSPWTERFIWRPTGYRESRFDPLNQK